MQMDNDKRVLDQRIPSGPVILERRKRRRSFTRVRLNILIKESSQEEIPLRETSSL